MGFAIGVCNVDPCFIWENFHGRLGIWQGRLHVHFWQFGMIKGRRAEDKGPTQKSLAKRENRSKYFCLNEQTSKS